VPLAVGAPALVALAMLFLVGAELVAPVLELGALVRATDADAEETGRLRIEEAHQKALIVEEGDVPPVETKRNPDAASRIRRGVRDVRRVDRDVHRPIGADAGP